jgi:hypothetical protein
MSLPVLCWACERCGGPIQAVVEANATMSPDPHLCRPTGLGWLWALWQGSGCRTILHAPVPPSHVQATARRIAADNHTTENTR